MQFCLFGFSRTSQQFSALGMCKPIRHLTIVSVVVSKAHPEKRQPAKMLLLSTIETYLWDAIRVEQGRGCFLEGQPESALIGILKHLKQ
mmetsp:Transcript_13/g.117  ORF Transcript_13/g.117 Transcript_13/m.117 type:complete len:89 (-) Transcript_13:4491-4757(-)